MKITIVLADRGLSNPQTGTVSLLNAGFPVLNLALTPGGGVTPPHAVVSFLEPDLSECNKPLSFELQLLDQDMKPVMLPGPAGPQVMSIQQQILIATPPGAPTGFPGTLTFLADLGAGLPLQPGLYRWVARINDKTKDDWSKEFFIPAPQTVPVIGGGPGAVPAG